MRWGFAIVCVFGAACSAFGSSNDDPAPSPDAGAPTKEGGATLTTPLEPADSAAPVGPKCADDARFGPRQLVLGLADGGAGVGKMFPTLEPDELTMVFTSGFTSDKSRRSELRVAHRATRFDRFNPDVPIDDAVNQLGESGPAGTSITPTHIYTNTYTATTSTLHIQQVDRTPYGGIGAGASEITPCGIGHGCGVGHVTATGELFAVHGLEFILTHLQLDTSGRAGAERVIFPDAGVLDNSPTLSADGLTLYFVRADETSVIWRARRATNDFDSPFGSAAPVKELPEKHAFLGWLSPDNCRLYYAAADEPDDTQMQLYVAERPLP